MKYAYYYPTKIGRIRITEDGTGITELSLFQDGQSSDADNSGEYEIRETALLKEAARQLQEYLLGSRRKFDLPLNPSGTDFQIRVWKALRQIPYGETRSYKQIACAVGNEKASRAVGMANHNNPIMCIIPCHRVIGANGALVGFGAGLDIKEQLLKLEKQEEM